MSKQIAVQNRKAVYSLGNIQDVNSLALILKKHIKENNLSVNIQGKDYTMVEGWQFAGGLMGLFPKIVSIKKMEGADIAYLCEAQIVSSKTNEVMSVGFAMCSKSEGKKKSFDEYAVLSMAQTRAIGKAYRNLIGWVMKMSGFEGTPAEEAPTTAEVTNKMFDEASEKIQACKNPALLEEYDQKIQSSKKYTKDQKEQLHSLIEFRLIEVNEKSTK